jgi:hypothetical protein
MLSSMLLAMAAAPQGPEPFRYLGLCEASAAAIISSDRFVVASDESNIVRIYERRKAGPVGQLDMGEADDLEGAAAVGGHILWVTSHSLTKKGKDKSARKQLIETSVAGGSLVAGRRFTGLRSNIAEALEVFEWPLEAALNVEGMAATPEGDLLFGLRAPLKHELAAVVRVPNPLGDAAEEPPALGLAWLDLGTRGIRSLERVGVGAHAYLIVAGLTGEGDPDGALFWWDGTGSEVAPEPGVVFKDRLSPAPGLKSRHIVAESAIRWDDGTIEIFGDNEANCKDGEPGAWFPSVEFRPGESR